MDVATAVAQALRGAGWGSSSISGFEIRVDNNGNCVECFAWDIDTYRAALYLFIGTCVEIKLYWGRVCRSDQIGLNIQGTELPQAVTWVPMGMRMVEIDDCRFDEASQVEHDDLQSMFLQKLGKTLPNN